jgi:hypothetical protein
MILNNHFEAPYNKFAPEGSVPIISKSLVKSKLSNKFVEITRMNDENQFNNQNDNINVKNVQNINNYKQPIKIKQ